MEYAAILMFVFAAAILVTALILSSGNYKLIPKRYRRAKHSNTKEYTKGLAKVLAICSTSPILCGAAGLIFKNGIIATVVLIVSFIVLIRFSSRLMKKFYEE